MSILFQEENRTFHLYNDAVSYIMTVLPNGHMAQLYFGKRIHHKEDFLYLLETVPRPMASYLFEGDRTLSLEHIRQEYGVYGSTDYRQPAVEVVHGDGSRICDFQYHSHEIFFGKPELLGLPATYTEDVREAETLTLVMKDPVSGLALFLNYTIFWEGGVIARSVRLVNEGSGTVYLARVMSLCMDLPDSDYEMLHFSGAWSRERYVKKRRLEQGCQSVGSIRGNSSHNHNPFLVLKRPAADEFQGEVIGFSLIYSGNFLAQVEVDTYDTSRVLLGIHPDGFDWKLGPGEKFQTPEAVMVYSCDGLNSMSQTFHRLYQRRLARGVWRDRPRPILINNWEATYFDFTEEGLVRIAEKARDCGVEMFVLDDGWFGARRNDHAGLGDWWPCSELLPNGIKGLSERIERLGMKFGLWFEPEMVNKDSKLYREHPDWILHVPGRSSSHGRYQYVLDYSRPEVVDHIYGMMYEVLKESRVSYIKWDMNRSITECYSPALPADRQGEVFHRYILGVYDLYERLIREFPHILFESCASGGGRFDPGMLYYAPQAWTSDNTDAVERLKIQYGTTYCYPLSSIGSHVSVVPNHQMNRSTPLHTRANTAFFGTFGYELDLNRLTEEEQEEVKGQIRFMKKYRALLQFGTFYRLRSPFECNVAAWMVVSEDRREALVGWYRTLNQTNAPYTRIRLRGLEPDLYYEDAAAKRGYYGDELMNLGLITTDTASGEVIGDMKPGCDFDSRIYILKAR